MVLYLIGLGLGNEKDITIKGYEAIKKSSKVYLESYTSILGVDKKKLESFYEKEIIEADRTMMEQGVDEILESMNKEEGDNAFLIIGDPFCATTHSDLFLRAVKLGIKVEIVHNASIINAVGCSGMQVYRFGEIISIPFFTPTWRPYSFYSKILTNSLNKLHTLLLLDIKVKEQSIQNLLKNIPIYEPPRFMSVKQCVEQLLEAEQNLNQNAYSKDSLCIGLARIGMQDQVIKAAKMIDFLQIEMGPPLHSFIICSSELHPIEEEMFAFYSQQILQQ